MLPLPRGAVLPLLFLLCALLYINGVQSDGRVVCYYTNWSVYRPGTAKYNPQNINPYLCTHLIYAFGGFTKDNQMKPFDKYQDIEQGGYAKFTGLKTYNKQLKTMIAIGGWNEASTRFSPLVANAERRQKFIKNILKFLRQNHFDGIDLDWEYPAHRSGGRPQDRENYAQFVQELRAEFEREAEKTGRPRLLLTMAVPAGIEYIEKGYDIPKLNKYLDWFNMLTYDFHASTEPSANHHAPLYSLEEESEYNYDAELNIDYSVKFYLNAGADRDKLVLGIPTYGRSFTLINEESTEIGAPSEGPGEQGDATREKGYLAYYEICQNIKEDPEWTVVQPNPNAVGPYAYRRNQWVGYDDEAIVRKKAQYVVDNGLGGIMFWAIDNDDFRGTCTGKPYPLIEAAKEAMLDALGLGINEVSKPTGPQKPSRGRSRENSSSSRNNIENAEHKLTYAERKGAGKRTGGAAQNQGTRNRVQASTTTTTTTVAPLTFKLTEAEGSSLYIGGRTTTPPPPTTPDPGTDFKCEEEGFFQHPRDCKKYYWCLDSGPSGLGIVAHMFTCPSGLYFNPAADSCDFARNVPCKTKKSTTAAPVTSPASTTTTARPNRIAVASTRNPLFRSVSTTTTTTTTTEAPEYEYEEDEEEQHSSTSAKHGLDKESEEDPKVIKELVELIRKVGGIEELEKHLLRKDDGTISLKTSHTSSSSISSGSSSFPTTPSSISKSLYDKVLSKPNALNSIRNSYKFTSSNTRSKSSSTTTTNQESDEEEEEQQRDAKPAGASSGYSKYSSVVRGRQGPQNEGIDKLSEFDGFLKEKKQYITINRNRGSQKSSRAEDETEEETVTEEEESDSKSSRRTNTATTPSYSSIRRTRPTTTTSSLQVEEEEQEHEQGQGKEVTEKKQYSTVNRSRTRVTSSTTTEPESVEVTAGSTRYKYLERSRPSKTTTEASHDEDDDVDDDNEDSLDHENTVHVKADKKASTQEITTTTNTQQKTYASIGRRTTTTVSPDTTESTTSTATETTTASNAAAVLTTPTPDTPITSSPLTPILDTTTTTTSNTPETIVTSHATTTIIPIATASDTNTQPSTNTPLTLTTNTSTTTASLTVTKLDDDLTTATSHPNDIPDIDSETLNLSLKINSLMSDSSLNPITESGLDTDKQEQEHESDNNLTATTTEATTTTSTATSTTEATTENEVNVVIKERQKTRTRTTTATPITTTTTTTNTTTNHNPRYRTRTSTTSTTASPEVESPNTQTKKSSSANIRTRQQILQNRSSQTNNRTRVTANELTPTTNTTTTNIETVNSEFLGTVSSPRPFGFPKKRTRVTTGGTAAGTTTTTSTTTTTITEESLDSNVGKLSSSNTKPKAAVNTQIKKKYQFQPRTPTTTTSTTSTSTSTIVNATTSKPLVVNKFARTFKGVKVYRKNEATHDDKDVDGDTDDDDDDDDDDESDAHEDVIKANSQVNEKRTTSTNRTETLAPRTTVNTTTTTTSIRTITNSDSSSSPTSHTATRRVKVFRRPVNSNQINVKSSATNSTNTVSAEALDSLSSVSEIVEHTIEAFTLNETQSTATTTTTETPPTAATPATPKRLRKVVRKLIRPINRNVEETKSNDNEERSTTTSTTSTTTTTTTEKAIEPSTIGALLARNRANVSRIGFDRSTKFNSASALKANSVEEEDEEGDEEDDDEDEDDDEEGEGEESLEEDSENAHKPVRPVVVATTARSRNRFSLPSTITRSTLAPATTSKPKAPLFSSTYRNKFGGKALSTTTTTTTKVPKATFTKLGAKSKFRTSTTTTTTEAPNSGEEDEEEEESDEEVSEEEDVEQKATTVAVTEEISSTSSTTSAPQTTIAEETSEASSSTSTTSTEIVTTTPQPSEEEKPTETSQTEEMVVTTMLPEEESSSTIAPTIATTTATSPTTASTTDDKSLDEDSKTKTVDLQKLRNKVLAESAKDEGKEGVLSDKLTGKQEQLSAEKEDALLKLRNRIQEELAKAAEREEKEGVLSKKLLAATNGTADVDSEPEKDDPLLKLRHKVKEELAKGNQDEGVLSDRLKHKPSEEEAAQTDNPLLKLRTKVQQELAKGNQDDGVVNDKLKKLIEHKTSGEEVEGSGDNNELQKIRNKVKEQLAKGDQEEGVVNTRLKTLLAQKNVNTETNSLEDDANHEESSGDDELNANNVAVSTRKPFVGRTKLIATDNTEPITTEEATTAAAPAATTTTKSTGKRPTFSRKLVVKRPYTPTKPPLTRLKTAAPSLAPGTVATGGKGKKKYVRRKFGRFHPFNRSNVNNGEGFVRKDPRGNILPGTDRFKVQGGAGGEGDYDEYEDEEEEEETAVSAKPVKPKFTITPRPATGSRPSVLGRPPSLFNRPQPNLLSKAKPGNAQGEGSGAGHDEDEDEEEEEEDDEDDDEDDDDDDDDDEEHANGDKSTPTPAKVVNIPGKPQKSGFKPKDNRVLPGARPGLPGNKPSGGNQPSRVVNIPNRPSGGGANVPGGKQTTPATNRFGVSRATNKPRIVNRPPGVVPPSLTIKPVATNFEVTTPLIPTKPAPFIPNNTPAYERKYTGPSTTETPFSELDTSLIEDLDIEALNARNKKIFDINSKKHTTNKPKVLIPFYNPTAGDQPPQTQQTQSEQEQELQKILIQQQQQQQNTQLNSQSETDAEGGAYTTAIPNETQSDQIDNTQTFYEGDIYATTTPTSSSVLSENVEGTTVIAPSQEGEDEANIYRTETTLMDMETTTPASTYQQPQSPVFDGYTSPSPLFNGYATTTPATPTADNTLHHQQQQEQGTIPNQSVDQNLNINEISSQDHGIVHNLATTTQPPSTTLLHIFTLSDDENATTMNPITEVIPREGVILHETVIPEHKIKEVSRIVEVHSKEEKRVVDPITQQLVPIEGSAVYRVESLPKVEKLGEVSVVKYIHLVRGGDIKIEGRSSVTDYTPIELTSARASQPVRNSLPEGINDDADRYGKAIYPEVLREVETSTIPLEGLFDSARKGKHLEGGDDSTSQPQEGATEISSESSSQGSAIKQVSSSQEANRVFYASSTEGYKTFSSYLEEQAKAAQAPKPEVQSNENAHAQSHGENQSNIIAIKSPATSTTTTTTSTTTTTVVTSGQQQESHVTSEKSTSSESSSNTSSSSSSSETNESSASSTKPTPVPGVLFPSYVRPIVPLLRPESNESSPLVISIANLDKVILSKVTNQNNKDEQQQEQQSQDSSSLLSQQQHTESTQQQQQENSISNESSITSFPAPTTTTTTTTTTSKPTTHSSFFLETHTDRSAKFIDASGPATDRLSSIALLDAVILGQSRQLEQQRQQLLTPHIITGKTTTADPIKNAIFTNSNGLVETQTDNSRLNSEIITSKSYLGESESRALPPFYYSPNDHSEEHSDMDDSDGAFSGKSVAIIKAEALQQEEQHTKQYSGENVVPHYYVGGQREGRAHQEEATAASHNGHSKFIRYSIPPLYFDLLGTGTVPEQIPWDAIVNRNAKFTQTSTLAHTQTPIKDSTLETTTVMPAVNSEATQTEIVSASAETATPNTPSLEHPSNIVAAMPPFYYNPHQDSRTQYATRQSGEAFDAEGAFSSHTAQIAKAPIPLNSIKRRQAKAFDPLANAEIRRQHELFTIDQGSSVGRTMSSTGQPTTIVTYTSSEVHAMRDMAPEELSQTVSSMEAEATTTKAATDNNS